MVRVAGEYFRAAHATPQGDLFESLDPDQWAERVAGLADDYVLLGHTHVQGMRTFGKITLVKPRQRRACPRPSRRSRYGVYDDGVLELKRCRYDVP